MSTHAEELIELRESLQRMAPPYLLRKYDASEQDYEELATEDLRCELINGVLIVHSPASVRHEEQVAFLTILLGTFIATRNLGRIMSSNTVMQLGQRRFCPDLSFLATSHADRIQGERIVGPMDLVVEMVSRSTREYDLGEKRRLYREGLIPEIWFIDPEHRQWEVDLLEHGVYTTEVLSQGRWISHVLAGLSVDVTSIWSDPLPSPIACLKQAKLLD